MEIWKTQQEGRKKKKEKLRKSRIARHRPEKAKK